MPGPNSPYTNLDGNQVLKQSFDETNDRLRVDAVVTASIGDIIIDAEESDIAIKDRITDNLLKINADGSIDANVSITAVGGDNIAISDGTDTLAINSDGSINVSGVSTAAKQDTQITSLTNIDNKLASIDAGIPVSLGQQTMANSMPVVLASDQTALPISTVSLPLPTGAATEAKQDVGNTSLSSIDTKLNTLGQKTSAGSVPVVLSSDQSSIPITLADEPIRISGTQDGLPGGTEFTFINNKRLQILGTHDRDQTISYADFGTKNQRITQIDYVSPTIPGIIARKSIAYTLVGTRYRRDSITWSLV